MSHAATSSKPETAVGGCSQDSPAAALRWLMLTDQRVASELGRAHVGTFEKAIAIPGRPRWRITSATASLACG